MDDIEENILAAKEVGFFGYHFDGDAAKLRRHFEGLQLL